MATRNVYSEAEQQMLEAEAKRFDGMVGWYEPRRPLVVTEESLRRVGLGVDPWNPLWHDRSYAEKTRWGAIPAYPTYLGFFGETGIMSLRAPAECGKQYMIWMGEDYEFHRPILPGDSFRIWLGRPDIFDVTPPGGDSPRIYGLIEGDLDYFNQHSELVGRLRNYVQRTFRDTPPQVHPMPEYTYSKEEIGHIGRLMKEEEIRGATTRYWEDVEVGEEARPIVNGPNTMGINALTSAITPDLGDFFMHIRHFYLDSLGEELGPEFILDPCGSGRYLIRGGPMARHFSDLAAQAEGEPCAWMFGIVSRFGLLRVLSNWMGDDGFVRWFKWRHMTRTRVGDTHIARAKVVGKRIENKEHLVDLHVWLRNVRGNVSEAAVATVALPSREPAAAGGHEAVNAADLPAFRVGAKVRLKDQPEWPTPPGFRFAGAEGTVVKWVDYDDAMVDFRHAVVCVQIESAHGEGQAYVGSPLLFRPEDVELV